MKFKFKFLSLLFLFLIQSNIMSQNIVNVGIGPVWPKDLNGSDKPVAWNMTVEYGRVFDDIIGVGGDFDFAWNYVVTLKKIEGDTLDKYSHDYEKKVFFFPISAFLFVDPVPNTVVHPVIRGQIGFNMAYKHEKGFDSDEKEHEWEDNGFYYGILGKASIDGVYDLGAHAAVYAGFEYQWGIWRRKVPETKNKWWKPKYHGPGIRMGFSFLF